MTQNKNIIKMLFETDIYDKIKRWVQSNGTTGSVLLNLGEYDLYGDSKSFSARDAIDWICRNWGEDNKTNNHYAVKVKAGKIELYYMTLPNVSSWGYSKGIYSKMGVDERERERGRMEEYSYPVFTLMKLAGYKFKLYKRMNTDLNTESSRKTVADIMSAVEWIRKDKERPEIKNKKLFYFKEGSYYYLYSVSSKHYQAVLQILSDFGIKPREIQ